MYMEQQIIGIAGPIAAGKGAAVEYFVREKGAQVFRFSEALFSVAEILGFPVDRNHLSRLSKILREEFGQDVLARAMVERVKKSNAKLVIVDGIRRPEDIADLGELPHFRFVFIDAPIEMRLARLHGRGEKADDATKTMEDFKNDHELEAEGLVTSLKSKAERIIDNSGDRTHLERQLAEILEVG